MPGIAGIISREPPAACRRRLAAMVDSMLHEPGYQSGTSEAQEMGVYAGWVAHPGSFAALESGRNGGPVEIVFAGECFQDISGSNATRLASDGHHRSGGSLLPLYHRLGESWVADLNGLFSGVLIDRRRARAWLFNDRYGVERIYVHETEHGTYFASEAKALLRVLPTLRSFDEEGVAQFLTFGCPLDGRTLFRGIRTLEGGSLWTFADGWCRKARYFTPVQWEQQPALSAEDFQSEFQRTFKRTLPRYLRSDSRIGISLTGGLDTRMIMACLPNTATPPVCYTFGPLHGDTLDVRIAARVAAESGLEYRLLRLGRDFLANFGDYVDRTVYVTDGSAGALGAHEVYLNTHARQVAPVRLTGNFGSEVLRSMSTFKPVGLSRQLIAPETRAHMDAIAACMPRRDQSPVTFAAFREIPSLLFGIMASAKSQVTFRTPYLDNDLVALTYRAPDRVRRSSNSALQLVHDAHPNLGRIATDRGLISNRSGFRSAARRLLAEATFKLDYTHQEAPPLWLMRLPGGLRIVEQLRLLAPHKFLSYRLWFQHELATYVADAVSQATTSRLPYWSQRFLETIAHDHRRGTKNYVREINAVLTLTAVDRVLLRRDAQYADRRAGVNLGEQLNSQTRVHV